MPQPNELWWSVVPGPSQLVEQLTAHLVRFESALIPYTTASFPWGEELRLSVHDRVRQVHPNLTEELCDASTLGERSPGRWVLDVVGRGEIFCLPSDDPIEIAAESGLLKQRIFSPARHRWLSGWPLPKPCGRRRQTTAAAWCSCCPPACASTATCQSWRQTPFSANTI